MANKATSKSTLNDPPKNGLPKGLLRFEEIFERMRARLGSSKAAVDEFNDLLSSGEWPAWFRQKDSKGKEIRRGFVSKEFWQGPTSPYDVRDTRLSVEPKPDGDYLRTPDYTEYSLYDASLAYHAVVTEYFGRSINRSPFVSERAACGAEPSFPPSL
jgi:hypothetical protein